MKYVHIAGTNGKGSVAEYIYRILLAAGKPCGCFTSPHLVSPTERLRSNGRRVGADELETLLEEVRRKNLPVNDTLFAAQTAAALVWFGRMGVEYGVLETGIGGRLDSTNRVRPRLCVLTAIDYDHTGLLGHSLELIARDKSGIIKAGVPVVSAPQHPQVMDVIARQCALVGAPLLTAAPVAVRSATLEDQVFSSDGREYTIRALGAHQAQNAAVAALAARQLGVGEDAIREGLAAAQLPCRAQYIEGAPDMLIDGAHNSAAVDALLGVLDLHFAASRKVLLFACMADKDYAAMIDRLAPKFPRVFVTRVDAARGADAAALCALFSGRTACARIADPAGAFAAAKHAARQDGALLVAAGSFYLAGLLGPQA